jgi:hypothetical protein
MDDLIEKEDQQEQEQSLDIAEEIEETLTSGVDIASQPSEAPQEEDETIELGDLIEITSKRYGRVKGRVYYRDLEMIKIMPEGVSDRVYDFPIIEDELNTQIGIEDIALFEKRRLQTFVEQQNLRVGFYIETFKKGEQGAIYRISKVLPEDDAIEIENEGSIRIDFQGIGIPMDADFDVIRMREPTIEEQQVEGITSEAAIVREDAEVLLASAEEAEARAEVAQLDEEGFEAVEVELTGYADVAIIQEVEEVMAIFRRYPETLQKSDLLTDLLTFLDATSQQDPNKVRVIRSLVEQYSLIKRDLLKVDEQGQPKGIESASVLTIKDLTKRHIPLLRPVVSAIKKAFLTKDEIEGDQKLDFNESHLREVDIENEIENITIGSDFTGNDFYIDLKKYLEKYSPLVYDKDRPLFTAMKDQEVFRNSLTEDIDTIGFIELKKDQLIPMIKQSEFAIDRMLTANYRPAMGEPNKILMPSEKTTKREDLLFPLESAAHTGSDRTGSLFKDIIRSQVVPVLMQDLLKKYNVDDNDADAVDVAKRIYKIEDRAIGFEEYLRKQPIIGYGAGDFHDALVDYGLKTAEINKKQLAVFEDKMRSSVFQIISFLKEMREKMEKIELPAVQNIFDTEIDKSMAVDEPILEKILVDFKKTGTVWSQVDVGRVAELLRKEKDLYLAVLGGVPEIVETERKRSVRRNYSVELQRTMAMKEKREGGGDPPQPNPCEHIKALRAIRSIKDEKEQILTLINFLKRYQGERKDGVVNCVKCNEFLLCQHEILQIEQAIYPRKSEVLAKQLHLEYAGGSYGRYYICKVCGQPFSEIGYDTHIEFDDEGRPMVGSAAMEDRDTLDLNEIENILMTKKGDVEEDNIFANELHNFYASLVRKITNKIGVFVDKESLEWIVKSAEISIAQEYDQETYVRIQKESAKKGQELDYTVYMARITVATISALLLIDIQTKIPNYSVQFVMPGCLPGFSGTPLESQEDVTGVNYICCAIASVMENEVPWNLTGFQRVSSYAKRQEAVAKYMLAYIKRFSLKTDIINKLAEKRDYLLKQYGIRDGRASEEIPYFFAPTQIQIEASDLTEAPTDGVSIYILKSHKIARETALLMKGSPFAETNCCIHGLANPNEFWMQRDLPELAAREMREFKATRIVTRDAPRALSVTLAEPPESIFHRLFLNVCFRGDHEGFPHEVGYDNKCTWCDFIFPKHPSVMNPDNEGKQALDEQNIDISPQAFQNLLDKVHKNYSVQAYAPGAIKTMMERFTAFVELSPSPAETWREVMETTAEQFTGLMESGQSTAMQVAIALGPLSELSVSLEAKLRARIGENSIQTLTEIAAMPADEFTEVLDSYFLAPFMRIATNTQVDVYTAIKVPKISYDHRKDIKDFMEEHMKYLTLYSNKFNDAEYAKDKLKFCVEQLAAFMKHKSDFKSLLLPGFQQTTRYMQRCVIYGTLATLCNPTEIPPGSNGQDMTSTLIDTSAHTTLEMIKYILARFRHEKLSYSSEAIKTEIAVRAEKERRAMIDYFDKMTDDEKQIALTQKHLGIGRFGAERSQAAWKYSASRYDIEKVERSEMGATDFSQMAAGGAADFAGAMDMGVDYGVGADFDQQAADDY